MGAGAGGTIPVASQAANRLNHPGVAPNAPAFVAVPGAVW